MRANNFESSAPIFIVRTIGRNQGDRRRLSGGPFWNYFAGTHEHSRIGFWQQQGSKLFQQKLGAGVFSLMED